MSLAEHVRTLGRGPGRSRDLTQAEAQDAMACMLSGKADSEAVGALLMLLRMKGENAEEIAGLVQAAAWSMPNLPRVELDWPSYAAGRTRGQPWFLLSARLVAQAGHRVLLHGWNGSNPIVRAGLEQAGISIAATPEEVARYLERDNIAYLPLETLCPALFHLLTLRDVLGLRSCVNTVCRMLNPANAAASVQGVFHPSYRLLQADAAAILGWKAQSVIKGAGGEFERNPAKDITGFGLRDGRAWRQTFAARRHDSRRLAGDENLTLERLWQGQDTPSFETDLIIDTAALALDTLGQPESTRHARALWQTRQVGAAA